VYRKEEGGTGGTLIEAIFWYLAKCALVDPLPRPSLRESPLLARTPSLLFIFVLSSSHSCAFNPSLRNASSSSYQTTLRYLKFRAQIELSSRASLSNLVFLYILRFTNTKWPSTDVKSLRKPTHPTWTCDSITACTGRCRVSTSAGRSGHRSPSTTACRCLPSCNHYKRRQELKY
jgi:hypothetical protein